MAKPYFDGGTASVTNGQKTITFNAVNVQDVGFRPGDQFVSSVDGVTGTLASIDTANDQADLVHAWPGTTMSGDDYVLNRVHPGVVYNENVSALLTTLANGTLAALATAGSGTNKLPYYDGVGSAELTDITALARTLLAIDNQSDFLQEIGEVTGPTNASPISAYPLGISYAEADSGDGWPTVGAVLTVNQRSIRNFQLLVSLTGDEAYIRSSHSSVPGWGPWASIGPSEIVTDSNGRCWRYADGTQICAMEYDSGDFRSWPAAFDSTPFASATPVVSGSVRFAKIGVISATDVAAVTYTGGGAESGNNGHVIAMGTWS